MKHFNFIVSLLIVCSIVIATLFICKEMEKTAIVVSSEIGDLNSQLQLLLNHEYAKDTEEEILSLHQAASYLKIADVDELLQMIAAGEMQGTYFKMSENGDYFFVRENLYQWCLSRTKECCGD